MDKTLETVTDEPLGPPNDKALEGLYEEKPKHVPIKHTQTPEDEAPNKSSSKEKAEKKEEEDDTKKKRGEDSAKAANDQESRMANDTTSVTEVSEVEKVDPLKQENESRDEFNQDEEDKFDEEVLSDAWSYTKQENETDTRLTLVENVVLLIANQILQARKIPSRYLEVNTDGETYATVQVFSRITKIDLTFKGPVVYFKKANLASVVNQIESMFVRKKTATIYNITFCQNEISNNMVVLLAWLSDYVTDGLLEAAGAMLENSRSDTLLDYIVNSKLSANVIYNSSSFNLGLSFSNDIPDGLDALTEESFTDYLESLRKKKKESTEKAKKEADEKAAKKQKEKEEKTAQEKAARDKEDKERKKQASEKNKKDKAPSDNVEPKKSIDPPPVPKRPNRAVSNEATQDSTRTQEKKAQAPKVPSEPPKITLRKGGNPANDPSYNSQVIDEIPSSSIDTGSNGEEEQNNPAGEKRSTINPDQQVEDNIYVQLDKDQVTPYSFPTKASNIKKRDLKNFMESANIPILGDEGKMWPSVKSLLNMYGPDQILSSNHLSTIFTSLRNANVTNLHEDVAKISNNSLESKKIVEKMLNRMDKQTKDEAKVSEQIGSLMKSVLEIGGRVDDLIERKNDPSQQGTTLSAKWVTNLISATTFKQYEKKSPPKLNSIQSILTNLKDASTAAEMAKILPKK